jgi:hypothetical protein
MIVVDEDIDQPINSAEIGVGGNSAKAYKRNMDPGPAPQGL